MVARNKQKPNQRQITLDLQEFINEVARTGQTPSQIASRSGHRTVAERRKKAFVAFCRRRDEWEKFQGNYVVPNEKGTVIASALVESLARAAGAAYLGCQLKSVLVIPFCVRDENAEELALALTTEFGTP